MKRGRLLATAPGSNSRVRGFSPLTIKRRSGTLGRFARWCHPVRLADATADHVESFLAAHSAPRTRHAYRSDLSAFYTWATRRGVAPTNPVAGTDSIRVPRALPRPVPPAAVPGIIAAAGDSALELAVALAAYAGLRRAEIAALSSEDVSLTSRPPMLAVRNGKGGKDRLVPLHPFLAELLGRRRPAGPVVPWCADTVGRRVAEHLRACGFDATCHQLRHSFGTELAAMLWHHAEEADRRMGLR